MIDHHYQQLLASPVLQHVYALIRRLFGVNITIIPPRFEGDSAYLGSEQRPADFCRALQRLPGLRERCVACDRKFLEQARRCGKVLRYKCHAGLREFIIPIVHNGEIVAYLQSGQVLDAPAEGGQWRRTCEQLDLPAKAASRLRPFFYRLRALAPEEQEDLISLIEVLGNYIANTQLESLLLGETRTLQIVRRAQSYINANIAGRLSLAKIARAAHSSVRNLTRVFLEVTHQTVLDYIQSARVARACRELRADGTTCVQVASECGFGSVSQFNKVFRQKTGISPSAWRRLAAHHPDEDRFAIQELSHKGAEDIPTSSKRGPSDSALFQSEHQNALPPLG
jgi:AraC-like DNA-binding protein